MSTAGAPRATSAPASASSAGAGTGNGSESSVQAVTFSSESGATGAVNRSVSEVSVNDMIAATPLGPILDRPVGDVLASLKLPALPQVPEVPPLPGLPNLPMLDLTALLKPLTDLLGGFGTGNLATAAIDPSKLFTALSGVLDTAVSTSSGALKVAAQVWDGQASEAAVVKNVKVTADTTAVSRQGTTMSIDIQTAAAIVGTGLSQIQGIIAATVSKIGATLPIIVTPAGQGLALGFAAEGLSQAIAVVTATRAQLLGPTTLMTTNGVKIKVTNVPGIKGINPFSVAGSVVDTVTPVVGAVRQLPTQLAPPVTPTATNTVPTATRVPVATVPTTINERPVPAQKIDPAVRTASADRVPSAGPYGNAGATPTGSPSPQTPAGTYRPAVPTAAEPSATATPVARNPAGGNGYGAGAPMVAAPAGAAGRGGGEGTQGGAAYLVSEDNGRRVVGEAGSTAPAVFGADDDPGSAAQHSAAQQAAPDIALRLNLSPSAGA